MPKKPDDSREWLKAAEKCLTTALVQAEQHLTDGALEKLKATESVIKTVGDIVGQGKYFGRQRGAASDRGSGGDDDD